MAAKHHIAVAGGGVAGLTTALSLAGPATAPGFSTTGPGQSIPRGG